MKTLEKRNTKIQGLKTIALTVLLSLLLLGLNSCGNEHDDDDLTIENVNEIKFDYQFFVDEATVSMEELTFDKNANLNVQVYQANENKATDRPLVLLAPGGAWSKYSQVDKLDQMAISLAKRGYVVGIVEYTLGARTGETYLKGVHDLKNAVKYFKVNQVEFRIDPSNIFNGGWSTGAHLAHYAAQVSMEDAYSFSQDYFKELFEPVVDVMGLEGELYTEVDSKVKGTLIMLPFTFDLGIIDAEDPAMMLIGHRDQHWMDGTSAWGEINGVGGIMNYGPDLMKERATEVGYQLNKDLFYLEIPSSKTKEGIHVNAMPLESEYYNNIVDFFFTNLD